MKTDKSYKKTRKQHVRGHKLTGVNIEFYQHEVLKEENLNLSLLVRDFLDGFLKENYPKTYDKFLGLQNTEEQIEKLEEEKFERKNNFRGENSEN